jgi:DNA-binding response OmpR family regulator
MPDGRRWGRRVAALPERPAPGRGHGPDDAGLDGLGLCRAIRTAEKDSSYTYLILLTSLGSQEDVLAGMDAGADDYVTKPLDPFTLHTRLIVALR